MKRNLLSAIGALILGASFAQTPFLQKTCYRGAFAPAPTPMWTDSWTEWDPQNKVYPAPTVTVNANITSNTTWSSGQVVLLQGPIYVTGNSILTIQPGVIVRGSSQVAGSGLFVTTGSKLMAVGTKTAPIVFTSDAAPGSRQPGDWGGIVLMGLANSNNPNGINNIEGIAVSSLTQYGGGLTPNDNDNSGDLQYIRIEFGGYVYASNKEINGLTLGAIGRATKIDFIQCSFVNDDAFEWFGGTVNCSHLVAYRCVDDNFDTDNGYSGSVQFALGVRDASLADPTYAATSGASTSEAFESDNDPNGTTATPVTSAIFSNVTDIGPLRGVLTATTHPGFRRGARIRRNSSLKIVNSILMDHKTRGLYIDGALSEGNANAGTLIFKNNIVAGYGQRATEQGTFGVLVSHNQFIGSQNDTLTSAANILTNPYNYTSPDYRPASGSIANSGASFTTAAIAAATGTSNPMVLASIPSSVCLGSNTLALTAYTFVANTTVDPGYCSLSWSAPAGLVISSTTAISPSFTVSTIGTFVASLTVVNGEGAKTVTMAITTATCLDVAVKEIKNSIGVVSLFPNPSNDVTFLNIQSQNASSINVNVYDITGKLVMTPVQNSNLTMGDNKFELNTSNLQNGIYFVTLSTANGKETVKLVVNK
ncbi:MAG: T9SS type A sorting domain-containing protein [Bacteroidia bacterium]|nr:T9SS type A sorting domain-containing protein [Bacteroidia bacterium]